MVGSLGLGPDVGMVATDSDDTGVDPPGTVTASIVTQTTDGVNAGIMANLEVFNVEISGPQVR
jgi:hypothetical protein